MKRLIVWAIMASLAAMASAEEAGPLLVRIERETRDDLRQLRAQQLPIVGEMRACLFLRGQHEDLNWLEQHGYSIGILDAEARDHDYLIIGLLASDSEQALAGHGDVLLREENWVLLKVERGFDVTPLYGAKVMFSWLAREPVSLPQPRSERPADSTDALEPDPLVQQVVDAVDTTEIDAIWRDLTDNPPTGTRFSRSQGCRDAADYCFNYLAGLGLETEYHDWNPEHAPNVVATLPGATHPDEIYVAVAHLDDLPSSGLAPGADDNASGSVFVLESARAMSCSAYRNTVRYLTVTGEEQGLLGSEAYAEMAHLRGDDIRGVINMDMPGWEGNGTPDPEDLDLAYNGPSEWLGLMYADISTKYNTGLAVDAFYCPSLTASDHASFWREGYSAIIGITDAQGYCGHSGTYPHYHDSTDTIENCGDPSFFYATVRTSTATLAELAEPFRITFGEPFYACSSVATIVVGDHDLNTDPGSQETISVPVWSDTEATPETIVLTERGADSMLFDGTIALTTASPVSGDGQLSIVEGDTIHSEYTDALDCDGSPDVTYSATATI
ncbi:MAG: Zn-dependent exopeptidase M28, partial [Acidobacteriota bacterium]